MVLRPPASAGNDVVQANAERVGKPAESANGAGSAAHFDVNDLDAADAGGASRGGLREATVLPPDP